MHFLEGPSEATNYITVAASKTIRKFVLFRRRCAKRCDVKAAEALLGTGKVRRDTLLQGTAVFWWYMGTA